MLGFILLHVLVEIDKKFPALFVALTGETQLRAKRTRIKILRAIAEKNGVAGFSEIKLTTGLSTGSIYYHLERMSTYVSKDAKHYTITEEGRRLLSESETKYSKVPSRQGAEEKVREESQDQGDVGTSPEEPMRQDHFSKVRRFAVLGGVLLAGTIGSVYFATALAPLILMENSILILSLILAGTIGAFFAYRGQSVFPRVIGYRLMLSVLSAAVILSGIIFLSGATFSGAAAPHYDNSMDALLSSYSLHWQVR
jgi:predicted transcriptional regulator